MLINFYTIDNNDTYPCSRARNHGADCKNVVWYSILVTNYWQEAYKSKKMMSCPTIAKETGSEDLCVGYAKNSSLCCKPTSIVAIPDRCFLVCEYGGTNRFTASGNLVPADRKATDSGLITPHDNWSVANILFCDGHVSAIHKNILVQEATSRRFWSPTKTN